MLAFNDNDRFDCGSNGALLKTNTKVWARLNIYFSCIDHALTLNTYCSLTSHTSHTHTTTLLSTSSSSSFGGRLFARGRTALEREADCRHTGFEIKLRPRNNVQRTRNKANTMHTHYTHKHKLFVRKNGVHVCVCVWYGRWSQAHVCLWLWYMSCLYAYWMCERSSSWWSWCCSEYWPQQTHLMWKLDIQRNIFKLWHRLCLHLFSATL